MEPFTQAKTNTAIALELAPEHAAVGRARAAMAPLRDELTPDVYADLRLVVSELVSNAVLHGPGSPIALSVGVTEPGVVRGEVSGGGDGAGEIRKQAVNEDGGRGLMIVDSVCRRWGVEEGSTRVWFELSG